MTKILIDEATVELAMKALEVATTPLARDRQEVLRAQAALREALAEQSAQQEPVAWMNPYGGMLTANYIDKFASGLDKETHSIPLYTTPQAQPAREPLTDDKYEAIVEDLSDWRRYVEVDTAHQTLEEHVRQVLTAHGITK